MTAGFDLDEIERLLGDIGDTIDEWDDDEPRDDWYGWQRNILKLSNSAPAILTEIRELRAENARLKEVVRRQTALASDHFHNARRLAARAALGEPQ